MLADFSTDKFDLSAQRLPTPTKHAHILSYRVCGHWMLIVQRDFGFLVFVHHVWTLVPLDFEIDDRHRRNSNATA